MTSFFRFSRLGLAVVIGTLLATTSAWSWTYRDFVNGQGDRGTGIAETASNQPGIQFVFGCDGDRWRQVALLPTGEAPLALSKKGQVRVGFAPDALAPDGNWKVREVAGGTAYFSPAPTGLMTRLATEERERPDAVLHVALSAADGKSHLLKFPLAGMRKALRERLWELCKLDLYFGEPRPD
jgi:hypothetical protein